MRDVVALNQQEENVTVSSHYNVVFAGKVCVGVLLELLTKP